MGQGDNQILREIYPEEMTQQKQLEIHHQFMSRLNEILSKIGPSLKMQETWTFRDLYLWKVSHLQRCSTPIICKEIMQNV